MEPSDCLVSIFLHTIIEGRETSRGRLTPSSKYSSATFHSFAAIISEYNPESSAASRWRGTILLAVLVKSVADNTDDGVGGLSWLGFRDCPSRELSRDKSAEEAIFF